MIDELIRYCIEEIGYDGEGGTEVDRLQAFIQDFHEQQTREHGLPFQRIDESYRAFVFKHLMAHAHVHVGGHVPGIPPQKANKGSIRNKESGGRGSKNDTVTEPALEYDWVDIIQDEQASRGSLDNLQAKYGKDLRIVLTTSVIKSMLVGSSDVTLTSPTYKFLQLVCRARQHAIVSTDLGERMRYEQKTIFYIAKKLIDAGLIAKIRGSETGTSASFFVAVKFLHKCPLYIRQRQAEQSGNQEKKGGKAPKATHLLLERKDDDEGDDDKDDAQMQDTPALELEEDESNDGPSKGFHQLNVAETALWLGSRTDLTRQRIYTLCNCTMAKVVLREHLFQRLKMQQSAKFKKALSQVLEKAVTSGYLEIVQIVAPGQEGARAIRKGIRMTEKGEEEMNALAKGDRVDPEAQQRDARMLARRAALERDVSMSGPALFREITVERQMHELVAATGSTGMTLRQLGSALHASGNASRTLEQMVTRAEEATGEASLQDLRIRQVQEFVRRVKRLRLYSQHAWVLQGAKEGFLDDADRHSLEKAGDFPALNPSAFWTDANDAKKRTQELAASDIYLGDGDGSPTKTSRDPSKKKLGRPLKNATPGAPAASNTLKRKGRPLGSPNKKGKKCDKVAPGDQLEPAAAGPSSIPMEEEQDQSSELPTPAQRAAKRCKTGSGKVDVAPAATPSKSVRSTRMESNRLASTASGSPEAADVPVQEGSSTPAEAMQQTLSTPMQQISDATPVGSPAPQRPKRVIKRESQPASEKKSRTNMTAVRSTQALVQCVQEAGGMLDSLSIPRELEAYLQNNPIDAQVVNLREKRVRDNAITRAIDQGVLKRTYVKIETPDARPQRTIVFLPDADPSAVQKFCDEVRRGTGGWQRPNTSSVLTTQTDQVSLQGGDLRNLYILRPWEEQTKLNSTSFESNAELLDVMRAAFFHQEKPKRQYFGFPTAAATRIKIFHLACVDTVREGQTEKARSTPIPTIDISYFWTEAPLDLFLAIYPVRGVPETVDQAYHHPETKSLPLSQQSMETRQALRLGSQQNPQVDAEVVTAICSLAEQLGIMGIIQPAQDQHDTAAGISSSHRTVWELKTRVALYYWRARSDLKPVTEICDLDLSSGSTLDFWSKTQALCTWSAMSKIELHPNATEEGYPPMKISKDAASVICEHKAWRSSHTLRPTQKKFLTRFVVPGQKLPSDYLALIAARICLAPFRVVKRYWHGIDEMERKAAEEGAPRKHIHIHWPLDIAGIDVKSSSASLEKQTLIMERKGRLTTLRKARELRQKRLEDYEGMLNEGFEAFPAAAHLREKVEWAMRSIRKRYVDSDPGFGFDETRRAVTRAVSSAAGVKPKFHQLKPLAQKNGAATPTDAPTQQQNGVQQGGNAVGGGRRRKSSRRTTDSTNFWTPQKNELLRDAAVILRARDRARGRTDWTALLQVLDSNDKSKARGFVLSQWRAQYTKMRGNYGEEGYLNALERKWVAVSQQARSKGLLNDPRYPSATDFSLKEHIDYLRSHIDKNEVHSSLDKAGDDVVLPLDLADNDFTEGWVEDTHGTQSGSKWESFFSMDGGHVAKRLEMLLSNAITVVPPSASALAPDERQLKEQLAESAVKMIIMTNDQETSEAAMMTFCQANGEAEMESALIRLMGNKTIRPLSTEAASRRKPGTNFIFTDDYQKILDLKGERTSNMGMQKCLSDKDGKFEASLLKPLLVEPVTTDGEAVTLVTLISEGLMTTEIDVAPFANLRAHHAFNARILNDEEIETLIGVRITPKGLEAARNSAVKMPDVPRQIRELVVGNAGMLQGMLEEAGSMGITAESCLSHVDLETLEDLVGTSIFLGGTTELRVVSSSYFSAHSLFVDGHRLLPRAWIDIHARPLLPIWHRSLETVLIICLQRPGISFSTLCSKFAPALTPPEIFEILLSLRQTGKLQLRTHATSLFSVHPTTRVFSGFA